MGRKRQISMTCPLSFDDYAKDMKARSGGRDITNDADITWRPLPKRVPIPAGLGFGGSYTILDWMGNGDLAVRQAMPVPYALVCTRCGRPFSTPFCIPLHSVGDTSPTKLVFDPDTLVDAPHWSTVELEA